MCSFFICDQDWEREREITLEDMGLDASEDAYIMEDTILSDEIEDDGLAKVIVDEVPENLEEDAMDALENCPTSAIVTE